MQINKKLLAIKGHFFFFNAGTAPLVPYLSTYARQLGFSSATVGLIYTILPIFGLIAKPLFGIIADRFKKQKVIFILFQIVTILSFWAIYFVPDNRSSNVELDCNDGVTVLQSCFQSSDEIDTCKVDMLSRLNSTQTTSCQMNCNMTSNDMWQTVCEHWHIPQYCYSNTRQIQYTSSLGLGSLGADNCLHIAVNNVSMDGQWYTPHCRIDDKIADLDEPCALKCNNSQLASALGNEKAYMTCKDKMLSYKLCSNNTAQLLNITKEANNQCEATCDLDTDKPQRLMEICDWWKADAASFCKPKTTHEVHLNSSFTEIVPLELPQNLSFTGTVLLSSTMAEHNCVYMRLKHIELPNENGIVTTHIPNCDPVSATQFFESACDIRCEDTTVNEIIESATDSRGEQREYTSQFGIFFLFMILSWIGQAVVVTFADAICFNMLGPKVSSYGKQRLWGSFGWGIFSLLTGVLIDFFSDGAYKDYTVAFVLMFVFMLGDVGVSCFLETDSTKMSMNILADVGSLLSSLPTFMFILWTIAVGMCTGLLWNFLFWLIEDVLSCEGSSYTKTLQGLVSATQTFGGEIPFLFISGYVLKKFGHENMMSLVLFAFGVRFILYSFLDNAWWVLPIELLQGITFGMFYPTMTSYATIVSPPGTETTVQGLVGAVFEGVGTSLGSFIGGRLYKTYGGFITFRSFGIGAIICSVLNWSAYFFFKDKLRNMSAGYSSVIRYEQPNDMIYMLEDINEGKL